jgi:exopolysaccharide biosynthesis polyprenyl glycosylphosphotransferase
MADLLDPAPLATAAPHEPRLVLLEPVPVLVELGANRTTPVAIAQRDATYRRILALADVCAVTVALLITMALVGPQQPDAALLLAVPLIVVMSKIIGIYDREESLVRRSTLDEAPALFQLATLYALIVWLINGLIITQTNDRREFLVHWFVLFVLLMLFRAAGRLASRRLTTAERCLVVGDKPVCDQISTKLARGRALHARVAAYITPGDAGIDGDGVSALTHGGDLRAIVSEHLVDRIIIAPESTDADDVLELIRVATSLGVKVSVVPRVLEVVGSSVEFEDVEGVPLLSLRRLRLGRSSQLVKRGLDLVVSIVGLSLLLPVVAIITLAIKLDSRGPVLFRQRRIGREGKPFEMLKFRTMVQGAEELRNGLLHLNETNGLFKIAEDPRITRVGRILRRASLDEIPQLWNVIRGDMSLVGPRPLIAEEDERIHGWHRRRLQLTPGMTGHWQILGSARIPLDEMVKIDYLYVTNWSIWSDIKILLRTIPCVLGARGL